MNNNEQTTYSPQDAQKVYDTFKDIVPFMNVQRSTLGGELRASLLITISLDKKETWSNNILENSRYAHFRIGQARIQHFSGYKTTNMRAAKVINIDKAIEKLMKWVKEQSI